MLHTVLFVVSVLVLFVGCAVLFVDVVVSYRTDRCVEAVAGEYLGNAGDGTPDENRKVGLFILALPEFKYEYQGRKYSEKSANLFFHLYLKEGSLTVPFFRGKTYPIYINPANPSMFVTSGEQRITVMRILGCAIALIGMVCLVYSMHL